MSSQPKKTTDALKSALKKFGYSSAINSTAIDTIKIIKNTPRCAIIVNR